MNSSETFDGSRQFSVLIVDDHPIVCEGLDALISKQPDMTVCGHAGNVDEALDLVEKMSPDVAVIDISLKDGNGINLISELKARNSSVRMLVSSMHDETLYARRSLKAGAMGYVNKQEASSRIVGAIRSILSGRIYLSERMSDRLLRGIVGTGATPNVGTVDNLSNRELEVFEFIGNGLSTAEIADKMHLSVKTIQTYRQRIKEKLLLRSASDLIRSASHWVMQNGAPSHGES